MRYRSEIDGLRAIAVLSVIFHHAGFTFAGGGYVGVDVFFVISGFLITFLLVRDLQAGRFSYSDFYQCRARRILPALFFVMACCVPVAFLVLLPSQFREFSFSVGATSLFLSNAYFWEVAGYFAPAAAEQPLLHTWSLAVEEHFYFVLPVVLYAGFRMGKLRLVFLFVVLFSLASFLLSEWGWRNKPDINYFFSFSRFWELFAGSLCALLVLRTKIPSSKFLSGLGLVLILASVFLFSDETPFPSFYALLPVVGSCLIILFENGDSPTGKLLSNKAMVGIGLISYSAYLWHQPLIVFSRSLAADQYASSVMAGAILLCFVLAYFSWKYVELPFRRHGSFDHVPKAKVLLVSGVVSALFVGFGLVGKYSDISLLKYAESDRELANTTRLASLGYMRKRAESHVSLEFKDSSKRNILIIGDSFAKDFINAIYEVSPIQDKEISLHIIPHICGNIYSSKDFSHHRSSRDAIECKDVPGYEAPGLSEKIQQADLVILASNWQDWQTAYIPETVSNIKKLTAARVVVLGTKNFGTVDLKRVLKTDAEQRPGLKNEIDERYLSINSEMKAALDGNFIDVLDYFCDSGLRCKIVSEEGKLFSFDGGHLTKAGAKAMGSYLAQVSKEMELGLGG